MSIKTYLKRGQTYYSTCLIHVINIYHPTFIQTNTMNFTLHKILSLLILAVPFQFVFYSCNPEELSGFQSSWPETGTRTWLGPEYWANRLQDWELKDGRATCLVSLPNRNIHLLTHQLIKNPGDVLIAVKAGFSKTVLAEDSTNWIGFRIGAQGEFKDYRDAAINGKGLNTGITTRGHLFIRDQISEVSIPQEKLISGIQLQLHLLFSEHGYELTLDVFGEEYREPIASVKQLITDSISGNIALVSHFAKVENGDTQASAWFSDWEIDGSKLTHHPERTFGPVMFTQYTLSRGILKMTAQMPPIGEQDDDKVRLEIERDGKWEAIAESSIDSNSRTAHFKIENWNGKQEIPYRILYAIWSKGNTLKPYAYEGVIRAEPLEKEELVVAGFTGNNDLGFPNTDIVENVQKHNPDLLFFSGDQIYEGVAGFGVQRFPIDKSMLDYLRKWYLVGWAYGDLMRNRPTICIPDDHDVYHGNIWGESGKAADTSNGHGSDAQDTGGYKQPPEWVNMVQRTQTSHLPDPFDPTPVLQNIGVYYTQMNYGGISFAILEDRKFKSAPVALIPEANIQNGWAQNRNWNAATQGDVPGAVLLGDRQLTFLEHWAADWSHGAMMKAVLSQTIFANVATLPEEELHDRIVPKLRILEADEYAPNDRPVSDMDSNGWPQTGRNKALKIMRKAFAFHLAGDQHLGSTIQYGVDEWNDAGFAFCVPAISNVWPRRWYPKEKGGNHQSGMPKYTGDFKDGFGNKITVYAVSNPVFTGREPARLYDRATGYGIVRFNKKSRDITMECWARDIDPTQSGTKQYPGWPITINQMDNYDKNAVGYLPELKFEGIENPVVQVINEKTGDTAYTIRIKGNQFRPKVFTLDDTYRVETGKSRTDDMKSFSGLKASVGDSEEVMKVVFD